MLLGVLEELSQPRRIALCAEDSHLGVDDDREESRDVPKDCGELIMRRIGDVVSDES